MTNSYSSSKLPVPLEIENPCSFNFFIPPLEESPSTPVCGVGKTGESITPHTEVVASPVVPSGENFPCSPTFVIFEDKSQHSEGQSVVKPSVARSTEEVEVVSRRRRSTNFAGIEVEVIETVPHNVQPVFDQTPKSFDVESKKEDKEEEEVHLVWRKKGIRGANILTVGVPDLETVKSVPDTDFNNEPADFAKERKRKGKGKMVESHTKGNKKRYGTRSEMHKVMESDIAANVIQTEKARKRRKKGHLPEEPTSTHLPVGSSDT
uniref:Uncharacterized protein n=1 Tax=Solanum tuberosum TaxID=4113 RepID=M1DCN7_SOLTU